MILAIDKGNTRTKAGLFEGRDLISTMVFTGERTLDALRIALSESMPGIEYIGIANVGEKMSVKEVRHSLGFGDQIPVLSVDASTKLPFEIGIEHPETIGADRIAAVAGGLALAGEGPLVVITAGTAITWNYLDAENKFQGGAISPGLQMRFRALHEFTAQLPLVEKENEVPVVGNNTEKAIRSGVVNGLLAEMRGMIENFRQIAGSGLKIVLTGGDAAFLGNHVKNVNFADEYLQLKGIHLIVSQNRVHG